MSTVSATPSISLPPPYSLISPSSSSDATTSAAFLLAAAAANAPNASLDQDYDGAFGGLNGTSVDGDLLWNGTASGQSPPLRSNTMALGELVRGAGGGRVEVPGAEVRPVESAVEQLTWIFLVHTIGFGCIYCIIAIYAFFSILYLRSLISARPYMSTINGFLCLLGASRAACLFIDPYNLRESMPKAIRSLLWDFGFPCLTSAFCLIQLAFLQLTQSGQLVPQHRLCQLSPSTTVYIVSPWTRAKKYVLNVGPEKLRRKSCLSLVISAHFTCLITTDVAATFHDELAVGKIIVQAVFLTWGLFLSATFLYGSYKVMHLLRHGHVPRRAGSSSGTSSAGGGCGGRLLPSESEGCRAGPLSPPPLSSSSHQHGPSILFSGEDFAPVADSRHQGIMQLAPLGVGVAGGASSLASSLALLPRALLATAAHQPPKIRITDEHERTFSVASSAGPASAAATPATPAKAIPPPRPHSAPFNARLHRSRGDGREGEAEEEEECSSSGSDDDGGAPLAASPSLSRGGGDGRRAGRRRRTLGAGPPSVVPSPQRKKSLSWREGGLSRGLEEDGGPEREEESSLLPPSFPGPSVMVAAPPGAGDSDYTLQALLSHISPDPCVVGKKVAKGKRGSEVGVMESGLGGGGCIAGASTAGRSRGQVCRVLRVTSVAALCCGTICLIDGGCLYACAAEVARSGTRAGGDASCGLGPPNERPSPWPWFFLKTISRVVELAMAIAMANVTKMPVHRYHHHNFEPEGHQQQVNHPHQHQTQQHPGYSLRS